ncbi:MAG: MFS transporter [Calditrichaeota bacterium]|nr:MAG: MFS transporter [Calditrichota bacterium]
MAPHRAEKRHWLNRNVLAIGLTSLFSDLGHEVATSILPVFLAGLGAAPWALGVIEGVADGISSIAKLSAGYASDKTGIRKPIAVVGYIVTAVATAGIGLAVVWSHVLVGRVLAWLGRGARSPVRDAILVDSIEPEDYGKSLGFERSLDTLGAIIGPAVAVLLVGILSNRTLLFLTLVPGMIAAGLFAFGVRAAPATKPAMHLKVSFRNLPVKFRWFLVAIAIFGVGDFAHTLLILRASQILQPQLGDAASQWAIGLYLVHNLLYAGFSTPIGALADRVGKMKVLTAGYLLAAVMNLGFILNPTTVLPLFFLFALGGLFIAVEDALERAVAADLLPEHLRATGFGALAAVNSIGDLASSMLVGFLWAKVSPAAGFGYAAVLSLLGATFLFLLKRTQDRSRISTHGS